MREQARRHLDCSEAANDFPWSLQGLPDSSLGVGRSRHHEKIE
jgi:hypothetical protein